MKGLRLRSFLPAAALPIALLCCFAIASAQTPREHLQQLVKQLQTTPADNALRVKIARLAAAMHPRPGIPEAARRYLIEGISIQKRAQSPNDYALAIQDYQRALLIAPWSADAYYDLAIALDLAKQFPAAIEALKLSVMVDPTGQGARAAQDKLYAVEGEQQQIAAANTAAAQAQSQQEADARNLAALYASLNGTVWRSTSYESGGSHYNYDDSSPLWAFLEFHGNQISAYSAFNPNTDTGRLNLGRRIGFGSTLFTGRDFTITKSGGDSTCVSEESYTQEIEISQDAQSITVITNCPGRPQYTIQYGRVP